MSPSFARTALQPRWLGLLALVLALATAFAALGSWQVDRSRIRPEMPRIVPAERLEDVAAPQTAFDAGAVDRPVRATGEFVGESLRVEGRRLDGETGAWVLTAFAVPAETGTATLPVVRGWVPDGGQAPQPPAGTVTITGRLEPSEAPTGTTTTGGSVESVSSADLVNRWGSPIYAGFLVMDAAPEGEMRVIPPVDDDGGPALVNVSYALQWWLFAVFAVFIWWRLVRDAHRQAREALVDNGSS